MASNQTGGVQRSQGLKFSTVIPSFNCGPYISNAIESIVQQAYSNYEIIVVDNCSTDGTRAILESYKNRIGDRFCFIHESDRGFADAVNRGLSIAQGDILSIQSADDYYAPGAFKAVADAYRNEQPLLVAGARMMVDEAFNIIQSMNISRDINITNLLMGEVALYQDATFFSREACRRAGPLALSADLVADYDHWIKILSLGPGKKINRILSFYTSHANQRTRLKQQQFGDDYEICVLNWLNSESYRRLSNKVPRQIPLASILLRKVYWYNEAGQKSEARRFIEDAFNHYPDSKKWPAFRYATFHIGGLPMFLKHFGLRTLVCRAFKKTLRRTPQATLPGQREALDPQWFRPGAH